MRCETPFQDRLRDSLQRKICQWEQQVNRPDIRPTKKKKLEANITELKAVLATIEAKQQGGQFKIEGSAPEFEAAAAEADRIRQRAKEMLIKGVDYPEVETELPSE